VDLGLSLKYGGAAIAAGSGAAGRPIGAEQTASGYEVTANGHGPPNSNISRLRTPTSSGQTTSQMPSALFVGKQRHVKVIREQFPSGLDWERGDRLQPARLPGQGRRPRIAGATVEITTPYAGQVTFMPHRNAGAWKPRQTFPERL